MMRNEGDLLKSVVVCSPGVEYFSPVERDSHNLRDCVEPQTAISQHDRLKHALRRLGSEVIDLPELPGHPNSIFTQDSTVSTPGGYIRVRMGLGTRQGEEQWMADALSARGESCAGVIEAPATLEGGDVILAGDVAFVGQSTRTNADGVKQIAAHLARFGFRVRSTRVPQPYLHLGGAISVISPDSVLCCAELFPPEFLRGFRVYEIPGDSFISGNVITLGDGHLIAEAGNVRAIELLDSAGFSVEALDLSEFVKGSGGPSCLIMPLDRQSAALFA